jgi:hypothetical protein
MNPALIPFIFYLAGSLCFVVGTIIAMVQTAT